MATIPSRIPPTRLNVRRRTPDVQERLESLQRELDDLHDQLRSAQKLASLGTVAAMVAHEYNNLATPVLSYAQYALEERDPALMQKALETVVRRVRAIGDLSNRLLDFTTDKSGVVEPIPLADVVQGAFETLTRDLAKDRIRVSVDVDPKLQVCIDGNQLEQVLFNLILNARQAMLGRPGRLAIRAEKGADDNIDLHVEDTGPGIARDHLDRLFKPFFTTKATADRPDRRGVGLGLAVCRDIVENAGGQIHVESTPGEGTTFTLTLPTHLRPTPADASNRATTQ